MILLISIYIPDNWKPHKWQMWERRGLFQAGKKLGGFLYSYELMQFHFHTVALIERCKREWELSE